MLLRTRSELASAVCLLLGISLFVCVGAFAYGPSQSQDPVKVLRENKTKMPTHANGTFEVKMTPQTDDKAVVGRYTLEKQFSGDLEGTSKGEMLAMSTAVEGSAGYVAMEQVNGTLNGRKGAFQLQHSGTMTRGEGQLTITVVPDSGTGQLVGLSGRMDIKIADGKHYYDFEYTVAESH
jgi:flagellar basal body rod protein FlgG